MKTLYIPTESEMNEMGFKKQSCGFDRGIGIYSAILCIFNEWRIGGEKIYPQSKEDISTLIRLFTK